MIMTNDVDQSEVGMTFLVRIKKWTHANGNTLLGLVGGTATENGAGATSRGPLPIFGFKGSRSLVPIPTITAGD